MTGVYKTLGFVDDIEDRKHIMLLYDDEKYRVQVQNRFILNGLARGQHCVCFTPGEPARFVSELDASGTDLEPFIKQGLVHTHKIDEIGDGNPESYLQNTLAQITQGVSPYFRCVGRFVGDISTESGIATQVKIEKAIQGIFDSLGCGYVSTYGVSEIEPSRRNAWISRLLHHHHYVIYATEPEKTVAFETDLLGH